MATKKKSTKTRKTKSVTAQAKTKNIKNQAVSTKTKTTVNLKKNNSYNLLKINLIIGLVYLLQVVAVLILSKATYFAIRTNYQTTDSLASQEGNQVLAPATRDMFDLNVVYLLVAILAVSAIAHLLIATVYKTSYQANLAKSHNKIRWLDYSVSFSLTIVVASLLAGIHDIVTLLAIVVLTIISAVLALSVESKSISSKTVDWRSLMVALGASLAVWTGIFIYVTHSVVYGQVSIPNYIYFALLSLFGLSIAIHVNTYLSFKRLGRWANYQHSELMFVLLSFVAKVALVWWVVGGMLQG
jgi:hypothetical protein